MNHFRTSDGDKVTKAEIDRNVRKAKAQKLANYTEEHGYIFCEDCGRNDCLPVDCSHDISVSECQNSGRSELAWDVENITLRGRKCHQIKDGLDLKFKI